VRERERELQRFNCDGSDVGQTADRGTGFGAQLVAPSIRGAAWVTRATSAARLLTSGILCRCRTCPNEDRSFSRELVSLGLVSVNLLHIKALQDFVNC